MKSTIFILCFMVATVVANADTDSTLWNNFKQTTKKSYSTSEEPIRYANFKSNLQKIEEHNAKFKAGESSYELGVNEFADMTEEEFGKMLATQGQPDRKTGLFSPEVNHVLNAPDNIDWREKGAVTPVRNQKNCGGCWAFATAGALEGAYYIKYNKSVTFSVQQLLDCTGPTTTYRMIGCRGGQLDPAFQYMKDIGLHNESEYPFMDTSTFNCPTNLHGRVAQVDGYVDVPPGDEDALQHAVGTVGPVAVAIYGSSLQLYKSGIFDNPDCKLHKINHAVLVVGYGTKQGVNYWIIKNSWGPGWGENGFVYFQRGNDICNVALQPSYPYLRSNHVNHKAISFIYIINILTASLCIAKFL